ncbi:MAG: FAD:protein FMN transferase [Burkholderiales bacterium]|nr:FAD:protein FMN transferase [Burkholderiales bacterium]
MPTRRRFLSIVAAGAASLPLARAHARVAPFTNVWKGTAMGALASLILVHPDRARARALIDACVAEIVRLEAIFSLYRNDSVLVRLNATGAAANPPHELIELLSFGLALASLSAGAFDPTVQPLYRLHAERFARDPVTGPTAEDIARVLQVVDYRAVEVSSARIRLPRPGMALTLNGIAQGYITDRVADRLRAAGFDNVLVDLGEARALGHRADGGPWRAAVRDPRATDRTLWQLALGEGATSALATSAGYGTALGADPRAHHLLDPHTGRSANHYLSVSVTAPRATLADGLSTALYVSPPEHALALLRSYPAARAYVVDAAGRTSTPRIA